ncbi:MAG: hypothetical protein KC729_12210, partial [Candidatus Eisenbacteria bacterium]|nr:hypothetical protein [Candidatus Eisenbacteria bacterium]
MHDRTHAATLPTLPTAPGDTSIHGGREHIVPKRSAPGSHLTRVAGVGSMLLIVIGAIVGLGLLPQQARARSANGIHVPTTTNFCGADEVVMDVTICNETDSGQFYWMVFEDGGSFPGCELGIVPQAEFLRPNPIFVARGACETIPILVQRPDELDSFGSVCFWISFHPSEQGGVTWIGGSLIDKLLCFDWYFEEAVRFLHPLEPIAFDLLITNYGNQPFDLPYLLEARDPNGERDFDVIAINGEDPGQQVFGSIYVPEGETMPLSMEVEWLQPGLDGYYDLVILTENTFEDLTSKGLHLVIEAPPASTPEADAEIADGLRVAPNPSRSGIPVRLEFATEVDAAPIAATS